MSLFGLRNDEMMVYATFSLTQDLPLFRYSFRLRADDPVTQYLNHLSRIHEITPSVSFCFKIVFEFYAQTFELLTFISGLVHHAQLLDAEVLWF